MKTEITDTERLDWINCHATQIQNLRNAWKIEYCVPKTLKGVYSSSLREAIDAAIKQERE